MIFINVHIIIWAWSTKEGWKGETITVMGMDLNLLRHNENMFNIIERTRVMLMIETLFE